MVKYSVFSLDEANEKIEELQKQIEVLKTQLRNANNTLEQYRNYSRKSYQNDYDYVPYHEDDGHDRE